MPAVRFAARLWAVAVRVSEGSSFGVEALSFQLRVQTKISLDLAQVGCVDNPGNIFKQFSGKAFVTNFLSSNFLFSGLNSFFQSLVGVFVSMLLEIAQKDAEKYC